MFIGLLVTSYSWGPIFHQVIAEEFVSQYLPNVTPEQKEYFVKGAIYVDGLPKEESHDITKLLRILRLYEQESSEYWFILGFILHMTADMSGHIGTPLSFLPLKKPLHYLAELVSCSTVYHTRHPPFIPDDPLISAIYKGTFGVYSSRKFSAFYYAWRLLAKLPFNKLIGSVENDKCNKKFAACNLEKHITAIKDLMWESLELLQEGNLTHQTLGYIVTQELKAFKCCD